MTTQPVGRAQTVGKHKIGIEIRNERFTSHDSTLQRSSLTRSSSELETNLQGRGNAADSCTERACVWTRRQRSAAQGHVIVQRAVQTHSPTQCQTRCSAPNSKRTGSTPAPTLLALAESLDTNRWQKNHPTARSRAAHRTRLSVVVQKFRRELDTQQFPVNSSKPELQKTHLLTTPFLLERQWCVKYQKSFCFLCFGRKDTIKGETCKLPPGTRRFGKIFDTELSPMVFHALQGSFRKDQNYLLKSLEQYLQMT